MRLGSIVRRNPTIPAPELITATTPLRLDVAARIAFPDGSMGVSGLRNEIAKGNLPAERIAGKLFVTLAGIERMRERCAVQKSAARPKAHGSTSTNVNSGGLSSTSGPTAADVKSAQAHLQTIVQKLKKPWPPFSEPYPFIRKAQVTSWLQGPLPSLCDFREGKSVVPKLICLKLYFTINRSYFRI